MVDIGGTSFSGNSALAPNASGLALDAGAVAGGAIAAAQATLLVDNAPFTENNTTGGGGAVSVGGGSLDMYRVGMAGNEAGAGGAILVNGANARADLSTFVGNTSQTSGGAVMVADSSFDASRTHFKDNTADETAGGAISYQTGEGTLVENLFTGNSAPWGGAVAVYQAGVDLAASTFVDNTAESGAALHLESAFVEAEHLTVAENTIVAASEPAGDAWGQIGLTYDAELDIRHSVIVDPLGVAENCDDGDADIFSFGFNAADDSSCDFDSDNDEQFSGLDPMFGPLQFNGGPTWTMLPAPESGLVDAIDPGACPGQSEEDLLDQRGVPRAQGDRCDIGAVEIFEPIVGTVNTPGGPVEYRILNAVSVVGPTAIAMSELNPAGPAGVAFPYGALGLEISVWDDGWPADVQYATLTPTNQFWKLMEGAWVQYPATRETAEEYTAWSFRLIDGADGDTDGDEDERIVDPVAMGVGAAFTG